jgi:hypothetical protein
MNKNRLTPQELQASSELIAHQGAVKLAISIMTADQLSLFGRLLGEMADDLSHSLDAMSESYATDPARAVQIQDAAIQKTYRKIQQLTTRGAD